MSCLKKERWLSKNFVNFRLTVDELSIENRVFLKKTRENGSC